MHPNLLRSRQRLWIGRAFALIGILFIAACATTRPQPSEPYGNMAWPPPAPSATMVLPRSLISGTVELPSLAETARRLEVALEAAGYLEFRYYEIPGGFALLTRLERINSDGTPRAGDARWDLGSHSNYSLRDLIMGVFFGNPGRYRIIAFVFTDEAWEFEQEEVTIADATRWFTVGSLWLPSRTGERPFTERHGATALIYDFNQIKIDEAASILLPSPIQGRTHLEQSMILVHLR